MKKAEKKHSRKKGCLIALIILLTIAAIITAWIYSKVNQRIRVNLDEEKIEQVQNDFDDESLKGYWNIAVFGVDSRTNELIKNTRSDSIIVVSIDKKTKDVKLVSIYRDTLADIDGAGFRKINSAYALGGPQLAIETINRMFDLDIKDFVTVNFASITNLVNLIDGVDVKIEEDEISALNKNIKDCNKLNDTNSPYIDKPGTYNLDGTQALAYSRIRKTSGSDFRRTQRQRTIIMSVLKKAKSSSLITINKVIDEMFPQVATDLSVTDIFSLAKDVFSFDIAEDSGFPFDKRSATVSGASVIIADDLEQNVIKLHQMLFGTESYTPSSTVKNLSEQLKKFR